MAGGKWQQSLLRKGGLQENNVRLAHLLGARVCTKQFKDMINGISFQKQPCEVGFVVSSCVTLRKLLNHSVLQFPVWKMR